MSDARTREPGWPQGELMEVVSSTEGAGPEGSSINPAQTGSQASTSEGVSRGQQHAYVQARLAAIENRMGIDVPTGA